MRAIKTKKKTKTVQNPMKLLRTRLSAAGVKPKFLNTVVLPSWWTDSIANSEGGFREGASYISSRLGFSLKGLLDGHEALDFAHQDGVKFKKSKEVTEEDVNLATNCALGVARSVASAFAERPPALEVQEPSAWREKLLTISNRPWVCLRHILQESWKLGIPVIRVENIPTGAKKPDALTAMVGERPVIVVLNGRKSPSWIAFIVAHELGHVHYKHLKAGQTLVDEKIDQQDREKEEVAANDYAANLLTGHSNLGLHTTRRLTAQELADQATIFGENYRIAPGVAALNYGFTTGFWPVATGAVSILERDDDAGKDLKAAMKSHLSRDDFSEDAWEWVARATDYS